jgi:hypothetical protein
MIPQATHANTLMSRTSPILGMVVTIRATRPQCAHFGASTEITRSPLPSMVPPAAFPAATRRGRIGSQPRDPPLQGFVPFLGALETGGAVGNYPSVGAGRWLARRSPSPGRNDDHRSLAGKAIRQDDRDQDDPETDKWQQMD